jgi:hypothetical protein
VIAERAAILEYDAGMLRAEAEAQAIDEACEEHAAVDRLPSGILSELIRAARWRRHPELVSLLEPLGVVNARSPIWGIGRVVVEGEAFLPAAPGEIGHSALIVPAFDCHGLADLVAQGLLSGRLARRLGVAVLLGLEQVEIARETGEPLLVFDTPLAWLRGSTRGSVIVDWREAGFELDGVRTIYCKRSIAPRVHDITRRCWPVPKIFIPGSTEQRHVA